MCRAQKGIPDWSNSMRNCWIWNFTVLFASSAEPLDHFFLCQLWFLDTCPGGIPLLVGTGFWVHIPDVGDLRSALFALRSPNSTWSPFTFADHLIILTNGKPDAGQRSQCVVTSLLRWRKLLKGLFF